MTSKLPPGKPAQKQTQLSLLLWHCIATKQLATVFLILITMAATMVFGAKKCVRQSVASNEDCRKSSLRTVLSHPTRMIDLPEALSNCAVFSARRKDRIKPLRRQGLCLFSHGQLMEHFLIMLSHAPQIGDKGSIRKMVTWQSSRLGHFQDLQDPT